MGNVFKSLNRVEEAVKSFQAALDLYVAHNNSTGIWQTADDLARAFLILSEKNSEQFAELVDHAKRMSGIATAAAGEVWNLLRNEPGRLADLSDQMINLTITRCHIAGTTNDPTDSWELRRL